MARKEYAMNTRLGALIVELSETEYQALTNEGELSEASEAVLATAALILSYLREGPASPGEIGAAAGINTRTDGSWKRALVALPKAGLVERVGYGPSTAYVRVALPEEPTIEHEASTAWEFQLHHTLILGAPATGKSNLLHALVHQEAAFVGMGTVKLYGIDPKGVEFRVYEGNLFDRVSSGTRESHLALIREIDQELTDRLRSSVDMASRSFVPSAENPALVLFIEELDWVLDDAEAANGVAKILAMGRSAGIFIVAAAQALPGGKAHRLVPQFANRILFYQGSRYLNGLVLGEEAAESGSDSTALVAPTYANGFQGAGVAFANDGDGVHKVRFPEVTDRDIVALISEYSAAD